MGTKPINIQIRRRFGGHKISRGSYRLKSRRDRTIWKRKTSGCLLRFPVFANRSKRYAHGLNNKPVLNVPPRSIHTTVLWFMSSVNWPLLCSFGFSCVSAVNSHFKLVRHTAEKSKIKYVRALTPGHSIFGHAPVYAVVTYYPLTLRSTFIR